MLGRRILGAPPSLILATRTHVWGRPADVIRLARRTTTSEAGENKTGHITVTPNESIIFFNNLLPINLQWLHRLAWFFDRGQQYSSILKDESKWERIGAISPSQVLESACKESNLDLGKVNVIEVLPRLKEGGAFLKINHQPDMNAEKVTKAIKDYLKQKKIRAYLNPFNTVRANLVMGKPWIEDLFRMPSRRLRVEFLPTQPGAEVAELSQEQLYSFFRPYGKLTDIITQPSESKITPRYAYLDFAQLAKAVMAKNCLHGYTVSEAQGGGKMGTCFRLTYEKKQRFGWVKDWIFSHPRIVIPVIAALIAGISIAVFDPIRTWSIRSHITGNAVLRWLESGKDYIINKALELRHGDGYPGVNMQLVWQDRKDDIEKIQSWLMETADTFIVVQGPRGSGKKELVIDHALKHKREAHKVLVVDCKAVQEARGEAATIQAAAQQVGYRPVFSWLNNVSGLMDLAAQSMTGIKAGFSETLETQLTKIYNSTATALKQLALEGRKKDPHDAKLGDDEYLEAHPERRPVVVIDNFLHKSAEPGASMVYDKLAEWAAQLTTSNIAHVIFLTNDVSFDKSLSKALPDRVFRQIVLADCSPEVAERYVISHLDFDTSGKAIKAARSDGEEVHKASVSEQRADLKELPDVISLLGGRLTDLEFLARRIKAGETPKKAVAEIIDQSASEILKLFLLPNTGEKRDYTQQQAWTIIRNLAATGTLRYNEVLLMDAYKSGGDKAITALEQAELITVQSLNGRPYSIKPGRPVYQSAFSRLTEDKVLAAKMELAVLSEAVSSENKSIDMYEQELRLLGELPKQPGQLRSRIQWLLNKISSSQNKIEGYEKESAVLKKVLMSEF